jgi:PAS domain S-box-containing protein
MIKNKDADTGLILITDRKNDLQNYFKINDIDLNDLIKNDEIIIFKPANFLQNNKFDHLKLRHFLDKEQRQAAQKNLKKVKIIFSLNWQKLSINNIIEHEARLNKIIPENFELLCQYNRNHFEAGVLKDLLRTHPSIIIGKEAYQNFYYIEPENFLNDLKHEKEFMDWMENLATQNALLDTHKNIKINFQTLFENSNDALFIHQIDGKILQVNQKACDLTGLTDKQLLNKNIKNILSNKGAPVFEYIYKQKEKEQHRFETEFVNVDGQVVPVEISTSLINRVDNLVQTGIREIKDRKETERKLRESEQKYRQLVETTGDIIFKHDREGKITFVNKAGLKFSGYTKERVLGRHITDFLPDSESKDLHERKASRLEGGKDNFHFETAFLNKAGEKIIVDVNSTPLIENGEYQGSLIVARDITRRKQIDRNNKLLQKQKHKSQKLETLGTLAGGIGHDFNNILTPILGYSEIIKENLPEDSKAKSYINEVIDGCLRAKEIITQMLSFSRDNEQKRQPLNIVPIVKEALKLIRPSIPWTIEIRQKFEKINSIILADPTRIHQVIMNLCTNAYQAMQEKGGTLSIEVKQIYIDEKTSRKYIDLKNGHYIKLIVSDTGKGMDAETREHIFEPFFTTKEEGTGMGLAVVHGIVKNHDGRINVYSEEGRGTTFNLFFPVIDRYEKEEQISDNKAISGNGTILLVDDRKNVSNILNQILSQLGYRVIITNSSLNALEIFQQHPEKFDLVITDMIMPEMNGLELSKKLRKIDSHLPILMISGHGYNVSRKKLKEAGINQLIHKPILTHELAKSVHKVLT